MYSQIVTTAEYAEVRKILPATPVVHPLLFDFAFYTRNLPFIQQEIEGYKNYIWRCPCWHCLEMRKRPVITGMDLYLRTVLLSNYTTIEIMSN